jgi:hypothetical protein
MHIKSISSKLKIIVMHAGQLAVVVYRTMGYEEGDELHQGKVQQSTGLHHRKW